MLAPSQGFWQGLHPAPSSALAEQPWPGHSQQFLASSAAWNRTPGAGGSDVLPPPSRAPHPWQHKGLSARALALLASHGVHPAAVNAPPRSHAAAAAPSAERASLRASSPPAAPTQRGVETPGNSPQADRKKPVPARRSPRGNLVKCDSAPSLATGMRLCSPSAGEATSMRTTAMRSHSLDHMEAHTDGEARSRWAQSSLEREVTAGGSREDVVCLTLLSARHMEEVGICQKDQPGDVHMTHPPSRLRLFGVDVAL